MDNVIWYLYFADVVRNLNGALGIILTLSIILSGAFLVISCIKWCADEDDDKLKKLFTSCLKYSLMVCVITSLISIGVPSYKTIYAAIGLKVVQQTETGQILTDDVKSILQDVKTIIDKQAEK